jgi:ubiquinone biosynthesis protein
MQIRKAAEIPGEIARAREVAHVLLTYGLAAWLKGTDWEPVRRLLTSHTGEFLTEQPFPVRLRLALTDLGTTFIKLGQVLSTRPDLVGIEVAKELANLRSNMPADPSDVVVATVERELARPLGECFADFDRQALASASIAQVHRATLHSGKTVVVKVQHPGIEGTIRRDLAILSSLAVLAQGRDELRRYEPVAVVREFRQTMLRELDFRREMRNLVTFRRNFAEDETVTFPKPYAELTTGRVLTMQRLDGPSVGDEEQLRRQEIDMDALARRGAAVFVQMIFRDGFYHADPHPGNIVVLANQRVGILDGGMVGRIDDELRERIIEILFAAADRDAPRLAEVIALICKAPANLDRDGLSSDLLEVFAQYGSEAVGDMDVGGALTAVTRLIHEYNLVMPSRLSMLIKCLIILEGTGRGLSAKFNLAELLEPFRAQFVLQQFSPERWLKKAKKMRRDWAVLADAVPRNANNLLDQLQRGQFSMRNRHPVLESALNRLAYSVCVGVLMLSSALLWGHQVPPTIRGVSVPGAAGYLASLLLLARLLLSIHRIEYARRHEDDGNSP